MSPAPAPAAPIVAAHERRPMRRNDVLRWPVVGAFLRRRNARLLLQLPMFALSLLLVIHGLAGPRFAPRNLATVLVWVHYRGLLVLGLLAFGNLFCLACPFVLARDAARRWFTPRFHWPRALRNKWVAIALFVLVLFGYERFDWWSSPRATAMLVIAYFAAALAIDALFKHASFCKFVCPIGQFNFVASTLSPLEVRVANRDTCASCATRDCIAGRHDAAGVLEVRGCELALFQPLKRGNLDCTFCLDCVHACPYDNVAIAPRLPGRELWDDARRSGIGSPSRRPDLAALTIVFTFGALMNAFGMVSPVYAALGAIGGGLRLRCETGPLAILFGLALIVEPAVLLGLAAWITRRASGSRESLLAIAVRHAVTLAPFGFAVWIAHYAFHLLTGFLTFVPVAQQALVDLGAPLLGDPAWSLGGFPARAVQPIELGFLTLGLVGSWIVAWRVAERESPHRPASRFVAWAALALVLFVAAVWLFMQPMEMRGTALS